MISNAICNNNYNIYEQHEENWFKLEIGGKLLLCLQQIDVNSIYLYKRHNKEVFSLSRHKNTLLLVFRNSFASFVETLVLYIDF